MLKYLSLFKTVVVFVILLFLNTHYCCCCHYYCCFFASFFNHTQFNNQIPSGTNRFRFVVRYNLTTFRYQRYLYITGTSTQTRYYANIRNLNRDSEYFISVRLDVSIASCSIRSYSSYYMQGSFSDSMRVRTNLTGISVYL